MIGLDKQMFFSVLIPLHNAEEYFSECMDSVLAQDFDDYEVVVIDDGSTDNSGAAADRYQKDNPGRVRVIHQENTGVLLTRRRLLKESKGEYILWVDADDAVKPDMMKNLYGEITDKSLDVIVCNFEFYDKPGETVRTLPLPDKAIVRGKEKHDVYTKLLLGRDMNELWTKCIKRSIIDIDADYTEYKHVRNGDDRFCLMPILDAAESIEHLEASYYRYRILPESITHSNNHLGYYSSRTVFERMAEYIDKWDFTEKERFWLRSMFANQIVDYAVKCANNPEVDYKTFCGFTDDILEDEKKNPIFSGSRLMFASKVYRRYYRLMMKRQFSRLYRNIKMITKIHRIKSKKQRR